MDIESITDRIDAFWSDHAYAMIAAAGLRVLVLLAISLIKIARSAQRDRWVAGVTALVVLPGPARACGRSPGTRSS